MNTISCIFDKWALMQTGIQFVWKLYASAYLTYNWDIHRGISEHINYCMLLNNFSNVCFGYRHGERLTELLGKSLCKKVHVKLEVSSLT